MTDIDRQTGRTTKILTQALARARVSSPVAFVHANLAGRKYYRAMWLTLGGSTRDIVFACPYEADRFRGWDPNNIFLDRHLPGGLDERWAPILSEAVR